ncbi:acyl transferase/acyl hydrolase/lysophospholipase [Podospora didyma]|uniref:Acyl transferase/acyl hydrolase/lysophospholipase n=1 Tax=Podospora didyma TaxID=330526 RepID=A0AAE0K5E9_9PEZI|nr:acyl transferase/acyl hydrolase/lysophospholipase [Podospora didyma]
MSSSGNVMAAGDRTATPDIDSNIAESSAMGRGKGKSLDEDSESENDFQARRQMSGMHPDSAWAEQNVLTFDGGGVRGYYSLLQLQKLMEYIRVVEEEENSKSDKPMRAEDLSSFAPCGQPRHMSHCPRFTPYLPCHYFDYICGTSTGALITIMLSRLRMPVEDCLVEYENLAGSIFGNPRLFHQAGKFGAIRKKNKFSTTNLEEAVKDVIRRRGEVANVQDEAMLISTPKGLCRAIIVVNRDSTEDNNMRWDTPWIFRSYDNFYKSNKPLHHGRSQRVAPQDFDDVNAPRNAGQGTRFAAWKVARAATAAPLYFKPLEIALDDGEIFRRKKTLFRTQTSAISSGGTLTRTGSAANNNNNNNNNRQQDRTRSTVRFTDGGFGRANNPAEEVLRELRSILKSRFKRIGTWVSIGTARQAATSDPNDPNLVNTTLLSYARLGDPEPVHERMVGESAKDKFAYCRLNEVNGLPSVQMDEWLPRGSGTQTMETMKNAFASWAARAENVAKFQKCAKALVQNRRKRASESKSLWERYALGKFYVCPEDDCIYDPDETWHYRTTFLQHLKWPHMKRNEAEIEAMLEQCEYVWEYKPPNY